MKISTIYFFALFFIFEWSAHSQTIGCQAYRGAQIPIYYSAENLRSDTFDVLSYSISLTVGNSSNPTLKGNTKIRFAPKLSNRSFIFFDLLQLSVDSVKENNTLLSYTHINSRLKINFTTSKNITDTSVITVFYGGQPATDASGWGGFYFDNTQGAEYAYNLGVGFAAVPHNYGRVWFPCFDNFVEKSKYRFVITSDSARRSYCNGNLVSDVVSGTNRTRTWALNDEIPTYLASITVAKYAVVNWTVNTLNGVKPIHLVAHASDTSSLKNGFVNLKNCISGFENYFGAYRWNRVGYCVVPFGSGAMEHATNITYPQPFIGSLLYESDLMAHELSHHWWGDLVTCETQEDMWINEGMASFSAFLFLEWQYGKKRYLDKVKSEHDNLLHFLHKKEGFRAISGVPHSLTYGDHVYKKGADVAHTLRGYMGDSDFFTACKYFMNQRAFKNANSQDMRSLFETSSGQNLVSFFNNWVFARGWPHFAADSVNYSAASGGSVTTQVYVKQKLFGAPNYYNNVPLEITFFKSDWSNVVRKVVMSGAIGAFTVTLPFTPVMYALNYDSKISDATSHEVKVIKNTATQTYALGKVTLKVQSSGADSSLIRVTHNYVAPDGFKSNPGGHRLSNQRFWKVEGIISPGMQGTLRFNFDGTKLTSGAFTYLDTSLTIFNSDSIGLFYRANAADDWTVLRNAVKVKFAGGKTGSIETDAFRLGEYAFGNLGDTSSVGIKETKLTEKIKVSVFPNPTKNRCVIQFSEKPKQANVFKLRDINGKLVFETKLHELENSIELPTSAPGTYLLEITRQDAVLYSQSLLVE